MFGSQKLHCYPETLTFSLENQTKIFPKTGQTHEMVAADRPYGYIFLDGIKVKRRGHNTAEVQ